MSTSIEAHILKAKQVYIGLFIVALFTVFAAAVVLVDKKKAYVPPKFVPNATYQACLDKGGVIIEVAAGRDHREEVCVKLEILK